MLGGSIEETARAMGVTTRSMYRYNNMDKGEDCIQCNSIMSPKVLCKSNTYSVIGEDNQYTIVLNRSGCATAEEDQLVEIFTDYVFPSSLVQKKSNIHDYWTVSRIMEDEEKSFQTMCSALNTYTQGLSGGIL